MTKKSSHFPICNFLTYINTIDDTFFEISYKLCQPFNTHFEQNESFRFHCLLQFEDQKLKLRRMNKLNRDTTCTCRHSAKINTKRTKIFEVALVIHVLVRSVSIVECNFEFYYEIVIAVVVVALFIICFVFIYTAV